MNFTVYANGPSDGRILENKTWFGHSGCRSVVVIRHHCCWLRYVNIKLFMIQTKRKACSLHHSSCWSESVGVVCQCFRGDWNGLAFIIIKNKNAGREKAFKYDDGSKTFYSRQFTLHRRTHKIVTARTQKCIYNYFFFVCTLTAARACVAAMDPCDKSF